MTKKAFLKTLYACGYTQREAARVVQTLKAHNQKNGNPTFSYWAFGLKNAGVFLKRATTFCTVRDQQLSRKPENQSNGAAGHIPHIIYIWLACASNGIRTEAEWNSLDCISASERSFTYVPVE